MFVHSVFRPVQPNLNMVLRNLSVKEDLKPYTVDSLFVWEDCAVAAAHQVLDESAGAFVRTKKKKSTASMMTMTSISTIDLTFNILNRWEVQLQKHVC